MPLHQNQDGTWQWGKSGKKYKKKQDAIKQMKAIFASGYVEKKATLNGYVSNDTNNKGSMYMTYTEVYQLLKNAAAQIKAPAKAPVKTDPLNDDFDPRYEIKPGDTVDKIHQSIGGNKAMPRSVFHKEIKRQNPDKIKDVNKIKAGDRIYVPR